MSFCVIKKLWLTNVWILASSHFIIFLFNFFLFLHSSSIETILRSHNFREKRFKVLLVVLNINSEQHGLSITKLTTSLYVTNELRCKNAPVD